MLSKRNRNYKYSVLIGNILIKILNCLQNKAEWRVAKVLWLRVVERYLYRNTELEDINKKVLKTS